MAAPWVKILGIIDDIFHFDGGDGPAIKNNSGVIEARNSGDSDFVIVRGDTPVGNDDLTTKAYVDALAAGDVNCVEITFDYTDAGSTVDSTFAAVVGGRVLMAKLDITTAWDAAMDIDLGDTTTADLYIDNTDVKETKIGLSEFPQYTDTIASVFRVTCGASSATTGAGRVIIFYVVPTT